VTTVDHAEVSGTCASCHNGTVALGKPVNHIASSTACDDCHTTTAWLPAVFDHAGIVTNCLSCHNGSTATGKSASHILSSSVCEACHSTLTWSPTTRVDHAEVQGSCSTCHNGSTASGKPTDHFITSLECDECHGTSTWSSTSYTHSSPFYPNGGSHLNQACTACHIGNSQTNAWSSPVYKPDCGGCHAGDFRLDKHQGQTVAELRDCAGACHEKPRYHRVTDSSWAL
jgi:hypothetical protein